MTSLFPKKSFTIEFEGYFLKGDCTLDGKESVLFLHGAGISTRKQFEPLRQELWERNIQSVAFDFVGHGETGGNLPSSSLQHRFLQACRVIEELKLAQPLSIVAESMSGYTAIKLLEKYKVENLILVVPAVYHAGSFAIPFNGGFSEIIRKPRSWLDSDAWEIMQKFQGKLLICYAEKDNVIPQEIIDRLYETATKAQKKERYLIQKSPHKTWEYLAENVNEFKKIFTRILETLKT